MSYVVIETTYDCLDILHVVGTFATEAAAKKYGKETLTRNYVVRKIEKRKPRTEKEQA